MYKSLSLFVFSTTLIQIVIVLLVLRVGELAEVSNTYRGTMKRHVRQKVALSVCILATLSNMITHTCRILFTTARCSQHDMGPGLPRAPSKVSYRPSTL
jgi:hypothetical protein